MEYYQKYNALKKEHYIFTYTGILNFKDVVSLKELIEKVLVLQSVEIKQKRKILNILIEALQNTFLHGESHLNDVQQTGLDCMLLLGKENKSYFIVLGNFIKNNSIPQLRDKLDQLVCMDMQALRGKYLKTLDKGELTSKGGASLGLVKMFIDSNKNISYQFHPFDEAYSFFSIELKVMEK